MAGTWAGALVDTKNLPTSDYFIPYIVQKIMPVGLAGTFLAAPMAAVMSTADSLLILASAAIVKDLWRNYVVKDDPVKIQSYNKKCWENEHARYVRIWCNRYLTYDQST